MLIKGPALIQPSEITPRAQFEARRRLLRAGAASLAAWTLRAAGAQEGPADTLGLLQESPFSIAEPPTPKKDLTSYNNFYEFGSNKQDPALQAYKLPTRPWSVAIDGLVHKPRRIAIENLLRLAPLEERIYRLRCVEGWSMVVPWVGIPLSVLLRQVEALSSARYVEFESFYEQKIMSSPIFGRLEWPYVEGLRLDEAMHPLTLVAVGLYGEVLPNQNGAPVRIVVPWKYGFKSAKSIVRIRFVEEQPLTSWRKAVPQDYGFYSNVNPDLIHPHWNQARERRLGEFRKRDTLPFNGYADQVAGMYAGMDLQRLF
ncbi:MAG: protein-methionine-sulfoxide reductase catalytic subunit MsrP [Rhodocyclaceae bacterium]|nr:protein-methionine-sulfoxide reductase catalytic subunit MsrP [Rhodocyclaceae bacterium]